MNKGTPIPEGADKRFPKHFIQNIQKTMTGHYTERFCKIHSNNAEGLSGTTAVRTAHQIIEAFPWDTAPKHLLWDNDRIYREHFSARLSGMTIKEVTTSDQTSMGVPALPIMPTPAPFR